MMSIIVGISAPNFSGTYSHIKLKKTVDDLSYMMRYAQSRAITKNIVIRLKFDSTFKGYRLLQETDEGGFERFSSRMARKQSVPDKVDISSEDGIIDFTPDGNIEKQKFQVCNHKKCFIVSTKKQRGYVSVYEE